MPGEMTMKRFGLFFMIMFWAAGGAACNPINSQALTAQTSPHSWIDAPLDGVVRPPNPCAVLGASCEVISHSTDPLHIVQVELSVNGQVVQTLPNPDPSQSLVLTKQQWLPPGPGNYTLRVRAQNSAGVWGEYAQAIVTIASVGTPVPSPSPVAPPPPLVVPSATPVPKPGAPTPSPLPPVSITFYADAMTVVQAQCTTIHWQVTNAKQVTLDNAPVTATGTKQACPMQTTPYTLRVTTLDNQTVQRILTINVTAPTRTNVPFVPSPTWTATARSVPPTATFTPVPSDQSGPSINRVVPSTNIFYKTGGCGVTSINVTANISDPSGVSNVRLWYRLGSRGAFTSVAMSALGGNDYRATVNGADVPGYGQWQFYVTAQDGVGNASQSATNTSVSLNACVR